MPIAAKLPAISIASTVPGALASASAADCADVKLPDCSSARVMVTGAASLPMAPEVVSLMFRPVRLGLPMPTGVPGCSALPLMEAFSSDSVQTARSVSALICACVAW